MPHICLDDSPRFTWIELDETDSTNSFLRGFAPRQTAGLTLVTAEHQTAGRGQGGNTWESERGKNLLFSILHYPHGVAAREVFILSQAVALAVADGVREATGIAPSVKWPNDIYAGHGKLAGILIETELAGRSVQRMIAGIGLNVGQTAFLGDAPNPVSLSQLLGRELERRAVLEAVVGHLQRRLAQAERDPQSLRSDYTARLYRGEGYHLYEDADGRFQAMIAGIEPDGHLLLKDTAGNVRRYAFKEVAYRGMGL